MASRLSSSSITSQRENVDRLKAENPRKFSEIVTSHVSIQLDLNGDAFAEILEVESNDSGEPRTPFTPFCRRKKVKVLNQIFGAPLTLQHIERILPLISHLQQPNNIQLEGLFRKSGNVERQRSLRDQLEKLETVDFETNGYTTHDCAGVLKAFLGELPEPLLTSRHFNAYTQVAAMKDESKQLSSLQLLIQLLPVENQCLLRHLLSLLNAVSKEPNNLMDAHSLAIVFAMQVIIPKKLTVDEQRLAADLLTDVVEFMIAHADEVFEYPLLLVCDVTQYLKKVDSTPSSAASLRRLGTPVSSAARSSVSAQSTVRSCRKASISSSSRSHKKRDLSVQEEAYDYEDIDDEIVISSSVVFADRKASTEAAAKSNTTTALAELYAHIARMPDSSKKRKLLSRMNHKSFEADNADVFRCSVSRSIRQIFGSRKRRRENILLNTDINEKSTDCSLCCVEQSPTVTQTATCRLPAIRLFSGATDAANPKVEVLQEKIASESEISFCGAGAASRLADTRPLYLDYEYDSDDLQCSLLVDESDDDPSLSSEDYDDSDKENGRPHKKIIPTSKKSSEENVSGAVLFDSALSMHKSKVTTKLCMSTGALRSSSDIGRSREDGSNFTLSRGKSSERFKGYISPLACAPLCL